MTGHTGLWGLWQMAPAQTNPGSPGAGASAAEPAHGKWEVYIWLQAKLGLNDQQAHIGMFSDGMCDEVIRLCYKAAAPLGNLHSAA